MTCICPKCNKAYFQDAPDKEFTFTLKGVYVCDNCWTEAFAEEIAEHPIVASKKMLNANQEKKFTSCSETGRKEP